MTVYFSADLHFFHGNIIRLANRPFADVNAMNEGLIEAHNSVVTNDDIVWYLGDISFNKGNALQNADLVSRLNGKEKHVILGNHDHRQMLSKCGFTSIHDGVVHQTFEVDGKRYPFVLGHYPMREWAGFWHNAIHLYGHVHGNLPGYCRSMDVGVDTGNDYKPYSIEDIITRFDGVKNEHRKPDVHND